MTTASYENQSGMGCRRDTKGQERDRARTLRGEKAYSSGLESSAEFGSRDVGSDGSLGDLINGHVDVLVGDVGHHLEGNLLPGSSVRFSTRGNAAAKDATHHLDVELVLVLSDEFLSIVRTVEILSLRVLSGSGVVTTDDEVSRTEVLSDDRVPDGLAGSGHPHREGQEGERSHALGVRANDGLVNADTREVVNISGLRESDDGVDEDVGVLLTGSTNGELSVGSVHRVAGLERDDAGPRELVEVGSELGGGV